MENQPTKGIDIKAFLENFNNNLIDKPMVPIKTIVKRFVSTDFNNPNAFELRTINIYPNNYNNYKYKYNRYEYIDYKMPSGKVVKVQGYEPFALDILLKTYNEKQIIVGDKKKAPYINWIDSCGNFHRYYVDIYIPCENRMIEVKGIGTYYQLEDCEKKLKVPTECIRNGYNYEYWVFDEKRNRTVFSGFTTNYRNNMEILTRE